MVVFMLKHLRLAGCPFPEDAFQCHPCPITTSGGFSPQYGILLCQDRVYYKKRMEDTMAHELIHAFDHCRFKVDWNNLRHHACSEVSRICCYLPQQEQVQSNWFLSGIPDEQIRAANLSGDCNWSREVDRGFYRFNKQHQVRQIPLVLCPTIVRDELTSELRET